MITPDYGHLEFFRAGRCESQTGCTISLSVDLAKVMEDILSDIDDRDLDAIEVPLVSIDYIKLI